jgi:hypothetical protein
MCFASFFSEDLMGNPDKLLGMFRFALRWQTDKFCCHARLPPFLTNVPSSSSRKASSSSA